MNNSMNDFQNIFYNNQKKDDEAIDQKFVFPKSVKFISFEGGEGCGKSTQSKMLFEYLKSQNVEVLLTREIGGTVEAEKIRDVLLHSNLLPMSEVMLVMAARFEHLNKVIIPALKRGTWVICDRFIDSTAVYQGYTSDIGIERIYELYTTQISQLMPDLTFYIDLHPTIALQRAKVRGDNNKFEDKDFEFHKNIYNGFQKIFQRFKNRIIRIDAQDCTKDELFQKIISKINDVK